MLTIAMKPKEVVSGVLISHINISLLVPVDYHVT